MEASPKAELAFTKEAEIKAHVKTMRTTWIRLGGALHDFYENGMYKALGYKTFEEWIAQPEVEIPRREIFKLKMVWKHLVLERGVDPADLEGTAITKIERVMPHIRRGNAKLEDALSDAKTLTRNDLRDRYRDASRDPDVPWDAELEPLRVKCNVCGNWYVP